MLTNGDTPPRSAGRLGGRGRKLPPGDELEKLLRQPGMTQGKVGRMYGTTGQAVSKELKKHREGREVGASAWQRYWPREWFAGGNAIRNDHSNTYIYKQLWRYTQRRQGVQLEDARVEQLDKFLDHLRKNDLVVYYLYDSPNGFFMRTRREHDDPNVIWADGP
jgi:hypothetical protein